MVVNLTRPRRANADAGATLIELIVAIVVSAVLFAVLATLVVHASGNGVDHSERTAEWNTMNEASTLLDHDVRDAQVIRTADADHLVMLVVRGEGCGIRDWKIDPATRELTLTTTVYEQASCSGPTGKARLDITVPRVTEATEFTYKGWDTLTPLPAPVEQPKYISVVGWTIDAQPYTTRTGQTLTLSTAAPADPTGHDPANDATVVRGAAPVLKVITNPAGKEQPDLSWTDLSPSVTQSWVVWRTTAPDGVTSGPLAQGTTPVAWPADGVSTWTDTTLPAGFTAVYSVQARLTDGTYGPVSNTVVTGIRPAMVTGVTATGQPTAVKVTWDPATGATGYQVYRDDTLAVYVTDPTWTDGPGQSGWTGDGYGHAHKYRVVAVNQWEDLLTTGTKGTHLAPGEVASKAYTGGVRLVSADSSAAGAFTAPDPPTITVTPNTTWGMTVAWAPAPWTGAGPTSEGGVARDRGWTTDTNGSTGATANGTWTAEWAGAENAPGTTSRLVAYTQAQSAGQYRSYRAMTANAVGPSPASSTVTGLQRPPTPTCTATSASTRAATVTVDRPAIPSAYAASEVTGGVKADGAGSVTGTGQAAGATFSIDGLKHATGHTFTARNRNASPANDGWSDTTSCATTTRTLGIAISGWSSSTRSITATAAAQEGSSRNITLEGVATLGGTSGTWDPLSDGTGFTVTARNSDGVNDVAAAASVSTKVLAAPPAPACTATMTVSSEPGAITVSGGDQVRLGSSGIAYASPRSYSGLSAGTYTGYTRSTTSDGYNTAWSGWSACASRTVIDPYPSAWGDQAGCPPLYYYITPGSSNTFQIRRVSTAECQARWVITAAGADNVTKFEGSVIATGTYYLGSGASAYYSANPNGVTTWNILPGDWQP
ncbi:hypothetical protein [Cellulomonas hominis]